MKASLNVVESLSGISLNHSKEAIDEIIKYKPATKPCMMSMDKMALANPFWLEFLHNNYMKTEITSRPPKTLDNPY